MNILWCHPNAWSRDYKIMYCLAYQGPRICVPQSKRKANNTRAVFYHQQGNIKTLWYNQKLLTFPVDRIARSSSRRGYLRYGG